MTNEQIPDAADPLVGSASLLSGLVEYQGEAVVSRTLVHKKTGTVTLFAFDKGQGLSEHTTPHDALVFIAEGTGEIILSGVSHQMQQGEALIMPANHSHSVRAVEPFKMLLVMIRE